MLFNSYVFIFLFIPITLLGFQLIEKSGHHRIIAISWLVSVSLFFYGWWNPTYLGLILASIVFNYSVGVFLGRKPQKAMLIAGILFNLCLLGYFKYANFFVKNINLLIDNDIVLEQIILPLAISFFTFQQITYLVDAYRGETKEYIFLHYCLFVTFFPQLIAGPIVHHKEMLSQFTNDKLYKLQTRHLAVGLTLFFIGLCKKVVFADVIAMYATPVFEAAEHGVTLTFFETWGGALAYTFQLYFDFSGYSDMALGLARMFGIILPVNFFSPYKANNIIEFWRRWHITLSRFFRDYVYIPLGGNRKGIFRLYINLMLTMLLAGLWHGAGWTFVIWGGLHGCYLTINYGWRAIQKWVFGNNSTNTTIIGRATGRILTFTSVVVAWVMFRAESMTGAMAMYAGMFGQNGISLPAWAETKIDGLSELLNSIGFIYHGALYNGVFNREGIPLLFLMLLTVWWTPNTLEWLKAETPALGLDGLMTKPPQRLAWRPSFIHLVTVAIIAALAIMFIQKESEFLYFQF